MLTTKEVLNKIDFKESEKFKIPKQKINIELNRKGKMEFYGRLQGELPISTPNQLALPEKLVQHAHMQVINESVILTRGKTKFEYWIPVLTQIVKRAITECYGCKRYQMKPYDVPS